MLLYDAAQTADQKNCSVSTHHYHQHHRLMSAVSKVNQGLSVVADRSRDREDKCIYFPAMKKQIDRCQLALMFSGACG